VHSSAQKKREKVERKNGVGSETLPTSIKEEGPPRAQVPNDPSTNKTETKEANPIGIPSQDQEGDWLYSFHDLGNKSM